MSRSGSSKVFEKKLCWNCASDNIHKFDSLEYTEVFVCMDCGVVWNSITKRVMEARIRDMAETAERIRKAYALYRRGRK